MGGVGFNNENARNKCQKYGVVIIITHMRYLTGDMTT